MDEDAAGGSRSRARLRHISLRARLTIWVVGIALVIQATLSFAVLLFQQRSIREVFDEELEAQASLIAATLAPDAPSWEPSHLYRAMTSRSQSLVFGGVSLAVIDRSRAPLVASADPGRIQLDRALAALREDQGRGARFATVNLAAEGGRSGGRDSWRRVVSSPFTGADGGDYRLIVYASDRRPREMLRLVTVLLLIGLPIGAAAAGVAGWHIAGIAVRPLGQLQRAAQGISPGSIGEVVKLEMEDTEVARLQQELNKALRRIEEGYRAQERFLSNVSHELKTPISVVLTEAQTLPVERLDEAVRSFVDSVAEEMQRLGRMIESFLLLTRVRESNARTQERPAPVNDVVADAVAHCGRMAAQHGVQIRATLIEEESKTDICVVGHVELLRVMIENLVRNAVRFSPKGGAVDVEAVVDDAEVRIAVTDQGPGIPQEVIRRIFDRFAQAPSEQRNGRGTGLGLEIAKGIAEMHGGDIWADNAPAGGGARFVILLPLPPTPAAG